MTLLLDLRRARRLGLLLLRRALVAVLIEDEAGALACACREKEANGRARDDALALAERLLALDGHFLGVPVTLGDDE